MVNVNPTRLMAKVLKVLQDIGSTAVFEILTGGTYDPDTALRSGQTPTSVSVRMSPPVSWSRAYRGADSSSKQDTSVAYISSSGLTFAPQPGMSFTLAGLSWKIQRVSPYQVKDTIVAYELEITHG